METGLSLSNYHNAWPSRKLNECLLNRATELNWMSMPWKKLFGGRWQLVFLTSRWQHHHKTPPPPPQVSQVKPRGQEEKEPVFKYGFVSMDVH